MKHRSKFQHVFCQEPAHDAFWADFPKPYTSGESGFAAASSKYVAACKNGPGGPMTVRTLNKPQRMDANVHFVNTQKGKVSSLQFSPFDYSLLCSGAEDGSVHMAKVPESPEDMKENLVEATVACNYHNKKVTNVEFNPNVNGILATVSYDQHAALLDFRTQSVVKEFKGFGSQVMDCKWKDDGSLIAYTEKKHKILISDPRTQEISMTLKGFSMSKTSKLFWVPQMNAIGAVGFGDRSRREVKIFDLADTSKPIATWQKEASGSVLMPWVDPDNNILYLYGKGDGSVEWLTLGGPKKIKSIGIYRNTEPQKGGCWVPKSGLDVMKCEAARFLKLTSKSLVPLSFIVPRKATSFQEDIFPPCYCGKPALTVDDYMGGKNADVIRASMDPELGELGGKVEVEVKKTYVELEAENEQLKARVAELEGKLGITSEEERAE